MARRRPAPPEVRVEPELPERLRRFVADEWIAVGEVPPHLPTTINGRRPDAAYIAEVNYSRARHRYMRARSDWSAASRRSWVPAKRMYV